MEQSVGLVLKELVVRKPKASKWPLTYPHKLPWSVKALGSTGGQGYQQRLPWNALPNLCLFDHPQTPDLVDITQTISMQGQSGH